ncbi:winged helix-turn-helix transcriptional regulator [Kitasatospora sp. NPDC057015]|uniref:winged helix-turn-helix transcriptional regulator n=1 Tax=Kitasatospora sp. NPDC057015 TaxID=3346001 RepID=UPI003634A2D8
MTTSVVRDTAQAPQVQQALSVLSPPNTISVLRTLDRNGGELPTYGFADAMPWMGSRLTSRLAAMEGAGLISRARSGRASVVSMTAAGRQALRLQAPFTRWASTYQGVPETGTGMGAYTEQAIASLNRAHTVATVWALAAESESVYPSEVQDLILPADGPHASALYQRLAQMEEAGLVEREGEFRNYIYSLTPAGRALVEPLEALARWAEHHVKDPAAHPQAPAAHRIETATATSPVTPPPAAAPTAQPSPAQQAASRSQAAAVRSSAAALAFSHQAPAQPAPLAASAPARHR